MPVDIDSPEGLLIRKMVPFSTMPNSIFKVVCEKITLETAKSGAFLFKRGDTTNELIYLLKGSVSLEVDKLKMEVIKAGSDSSRFALAHQFPRKVNGVAKGTVQFLRLNSLYITTPSSDAPKKPEPPPREKNTQNWISSLLMLPMLRRLSPMQLAKINEHLDEVNYSDGEVIMKQGEVGEYFYLIKSGECLMNYRDNAINAETTLKTWDSFGAEALICESLRQHTVTALKGVSVLRLKKTPFLTLVKEPLLKIRDHAEIDALLKNNAVLVDVRAESDYKRSHWAEAISMPLIELRNSLKVLDANRPVMVISHRQDFSAAAAFVLLSYNFSASVAQKKPFNPQDINTANTDSQGFFLDLFEGTEGGVDRASISVRSATQVIPSADILAAENAQLKQQLQEQRMRTEKIEQEKQELLQKYHLLLKQSERLKNMLESLTK